MEASVTNLLNINKPLPDNCEGGYEMWRDAFLDNKAGVFIMPVSRVVNMIEETMSGESQSK